MEIWAFERGHRGKGELYYAGLVQNVAKCKKPYQAKEQ
jgi:hypothetical protein